MVIAYIRRNTNLSSKFLLIGSKADRRMMPVQFSYLPLPPFYLQALPEKKHTVSHEERGLRNGCRARRGQKAGRTTGARTVSILKHESRILRQSSNPVCGFSMMGQVRLCAVWPMENGLGSSLNHIRTGLDHCPRFLLLRFRARTSAHCRPPM